MSKEWEKLKKLLDKYPDIYIHFYHIDAIPCKTTFTLYNFKEHQDVFVAFLKAVDYISAHADEIDKEYGDLVRGKKDARDNIRPRLREAQWEDA